MVTDTDRRFTILDGMAMTAAVGVGLGLTRLTAGWVSPSDRRWAIAAGSWAVALPVTWMVAILGLVGPRAPRDRAACPPGVAACVAVAVASCCILVFWSHNLVFALKQGHWPPVQFWQVMMSHVLTPMPLAATVAATWSLLLLERRWLARPDWVDRAGRIAGVYWLAAGLTIPVLNIWANWR